MDRVGDELLSRTGLSAEKDRRVRGGRLGDELVHLPHRSAVADEVPQLVALAELFLQEPVLGQEPLALGLHTPVGAEGLAEHRGGHLEDRRHLLPVAVRVARERRTQHAGPLLLARDRNADERHLAAALAGGGEKPRPVEEEGLLRRVGDDHRPPAVEDAARDPLAGAEAGASRGVAREPRGGFDPKLSRVRVGESHGRRERAELVLEELDDPGDGGGPVERPGQGSCDLAELVEAGGRRRAHAAEDTTKM